MAYSDLRKIAFVGDYLPRKCGIATFTHDLRHAVDQCATAECLIVPVDDIEGGYEYPSEVRFQLSEQDLDSYRRAADFLNFSNVDVVSLQHEFGIYGGPGGGHILAFLRDLRIPTVTTLHTAWHPGPAVRRSQLLQRSIRRRGKVRGIDVWIAVTEQRYRICFAGSTCCDSRCTEFRLSHPRSNPSSLGAK